MTITDYTGYWPLDEGTGTTSADASGNGHPITFGGTMGWATAKIGASASSFPSASSADFATFTSPTTGASFSVAAWVKPTNVTADREIFGLGNSEADNALAHAFIGTDRSVHFHFYGNDLASNSNQWPDTGGTYHHLCCVYNAATNARTIYVNGSTISGGADTSGTDWSGTATSRFGKLVPSGSGRFLGVIDDFRIYGRALSTADVAELFAFTSGGAATPSWRIRQRTFTGGFQDMTGGFDA